MASSKDLLDWRQMLQDERAHVIHFLRTRRVAEIRELPELDVLGKRLEQFVAHDAPLNGHDEVAVAVTLDDGRLSVSYGTLWKRVSQWNPAAESDDSSEWTFEPEGRVEGECAALREAAQNDAIRTCPTLFFVFDQLVDELGSPFDALFVFIAAPIQRFQVKPGCHSHASVQGDRLFWSCRTQELDVADSERLK